MDEEGRNESQGPKDAQTQGSTTVIPKPIGTGSGGGTVVEVRTPVGVRFDCAGGVRIR
jgi:hypothetical protein